MLLRLGQDPLNQKLDRVFDLGSWAAKIVDHQISEDFALVIRIFQLSKLVSHQFYSQSVSFYLPAFCLQLFAQALPFSYLAQACS